MWNNIKQITSVLQEFQKVKREKRAENIFEEITAVDSIA